MVGAGSSPDDAQAAVGLGIGLAILADTPMTVPPSSGGTRVGDYRVLADLRAFAAAATCSPSIMSTCPVTTWPRSSRRGAAAAGPGRAAADQDKLAMRER